MTGLSCFSMRIGKKKKDKGNEEIIKPIESDSSNPGTVQISLQHPIIPFESNKFKSTKFDVSVPFDSVKKDSKLNVTVMSHENPIGEATEVAYEGEDECDENSVKRNFSDLDLQTPSPDTCEEEFDPRRNRNIGFSPLLEAQVTEVFDKNAEKATESGADTMQNGHLSDPGTGKAELWALPKLKRSCSNLESNDMIRNMAVQFLPSNSHSFEDFQELLERARKNADHALSPCSVLSQRSADKVMLKKRSSSQILPSRSKRLWWKLFLWSHRNLKAPWATKPQPRLQTITSSNQEGGYCSDIIEPSRGKGLSTTESPVCCNSVKGDDHSWDGFRCGVSGLLVQNQWVAFPSESSSLSRVNEWVKDLQEQPELVIDDEGQVEMGHDGIDSQSSPVISRSPEISTTTQLSRRQDVNLPEEIMHANSVIQSLNSSSTVAHMSCIGLRALPIISHLNSLRSVNLSGNFIVHITPGSLPKGLHTLNLSKNKITAIEGLRDITRLRVLDLSYNRISRIGQGLSNCTMIKELYLAGNKISDVEGLHRLLKLTVLDLSFNRITTTKALGQLVANYNSLMALNLLGNPIQSNVHDEQLKKAVCGLLTKLVYLNKQPIKSHMAREVLTDNVAKAALGHNGGWSSRKKGLKKLNRAYSTAGHRSVVQKDKHKGKDYILHLSSKTASSSSAIPSSSH